MHRVFSPTLLARLRGDRRPEELAAIAGVSARTYRYWEEGVGPGPRVNELILVADALEVPLDAFLVSLEPSEEVAS